MKFKATNLVTLSDKREQLAVRKADLDILSKLNQFSGAVEQSFNAVLKMFDPVIETQTIRASAVLGTKTKLLLVDDNSAIQVTVLKDLPIGHEFSIQRISSGLTDKAVTISSTDTFPFTSMFGNTLFAKTTRYEESFTFRKISATAWDCVAGIDSGITAGGVFEARCDGTMTMWRTVSVAITILQNNNVGTYGWSYYQGVLGGISMAKPYTRNVCIQCAGNDTTSNGAGLSASAYSITLTSYSIQAIDYVSRASAPIGIFITGGWY